MISRTRAERRDPRLFPATVVSGTRLTPNMQRVTVRGEALGAFPYRGYDHWFRLFFRCPHQERFHPPEVAAETWWKPYLAMPDETRPYCANYTVADFRAGAGELDIDVVVHRGADGSVEGGTAIWACSAEPGEELALLDQGVLYEAPEDASSVLLVADESGLPAVAGILRSLPADTVGRVLQEVPSAADRREPAGPPGVRVEWIVREDPHAVPGTAALAALRGLTDTDPGGYAFVVGEQRLATEGRRHLVATGMPKDRITFSGFWKADRP
ncbi:siderophore-interacting protein [Streptomyces griseoviridis]|jgi:NADPH-dependent ferric siderophore reductase|uniref:Siderophore-interacting protein n=1 Tax=Streptomyces griseoviridis TaxID=45398 RepID=A0A918LKQ1_STRGD|nr:siderophore-interacting protein [Streptomyces niveoruber]GGS63954.1 siderophore-interacting protein [Streptomyces niveoruber]